MRGRSLRTPQREATFLRLLAKGNAVGEAAAAIGCSRQCVYDWRNSDDAFRLAWDQSVEHATEIVESVLYKQARGGNLLAAIFWLKSHKPSVYNRKQIVSIGGDADSPPIGIDHHHHGDTRRIIIPHNGRDDGKFLTRQPRSVMMITDPADGNRVLDLRVDGEHVPADQIDGVVAELDLAEGKPATPKAEDDADDQAFGT
jgi:Helix-turn-helix domain